MSFKVVKTKKNGEFYDCKIEEKEKAKVIRRFTARVNRSQVASAKGLGEHDGLAVEHDVEYWCRISRDKLPQDGDLVVVDLSYVRK